MRLVSWNCNTSPRITSPDSAIAAFTKKYSAISQITPLPDVIICQEIARPHPTSSRHHVWYGPLLGRGIYVNVAEPYAIQSHYDEAISRSVVPLTITGPHSFHLLAVWSIPHQPSTRNYVREVYEGVQKYAHFLTSGPAIVIGDFNSNSRWDNQTGTINHSHLVELLESTFNLTSSYYTKHGIVQGQEAEQTFYRYRQPAQGFHIDYCFVPQTWKVDNAQIGHYEDWLSQSDHCPIIVDLSPCG